MQRRLVVSLCAWLAISTLASANGRPPGSWSITWQPGAPEHVFVGATFGALESHDGGATWQWLCEDAVGYGGVYDPDYAFTDDGTLFATTTTKGLRIRRDGCVFESTLLGETFVSQVERASAGMLVAAASANDSAIYRTTDGGQSFASATPGLAGDWWETLVAAPSDPTRVYLSGYRLQNGTRSNLLFRSDDGGVTFAPLNGDFFPVSDISALRIESIHPNNPDQLIARVENHIGSSEVSDALFISHDAGATWSLATTTDGTAWAVAMLESGAVLIGTQTAGWWRSPDGMTFARGDGPLATFLRVGPDGALWLGASHFADGFAVGRSTDNGATFVKAMLYAEISAPVACPDGTTQANACVDMQWCNIRAQLGVTADPTRCERVDAPMGSDAVAPPSAPGGCCDARGNAAGTVLGALALWVWQRLRRRSLARAMAQ